MPPERHARSAHHGYGRALFACKSVEAALASYVDESSGKRDRLEPEAKTRTVEDLIAAFGQRFGHAGLYHELQRFVSDRQAMMSIALTIGERGQPNSETVVELMEELSEIERKALLLKRAIRSEATKMSNQSRS